jgi:ABC-type lipoprotein release transport system permease subunit
VSTSVDTRTSILVNVLLTVIALGVLYLVIKATVRNGMREFLRDVAPSEQDRADVEMSGYAERLAARLARVIRRDREWRLTGPAADPPR